MEKCFAPPSLTPATSKCKSRCHGGIHGFGRGSSRHHRLPAALFHGQPEQDQPTEFGREDPPHFSQETFESCHVSVPRLPHESGPLAGHQSLTRRLAQPQNTGTTHHRPEPPGSRPHLGSRCPSRAIQIHTYSSRRSSLEESSQGDSLRTRVPGTHQLTTHAPTPGLGKEGVGRSCLEPPPHAHRPLEP